MSVPVHAHLWDWIAWCETRRDARRGVRCKTPRAAPNRPQNPRTTGKADVNIPRIVSHQKAHATDHRTRETLHARAIFVEIVVAEHRIDRRKRLERPQDPRIANITCMNDVIAFRKRGKHRIGQRSMRIGQDSY